jgi:hypothetical protein
MLCGQWVCQSLCRGVHLLRNRSLPLRRCLLVRLLCGDIRFNIAVSKSGHMFIGNRLCNEGQVLLSAECHGSRFDLGSDQH